MVATNIVPVSPMLALSYEHWHGAALQDRLIAAVKLLKLAVVCPFAPVASTVKFSVLTVALFGMLRVKQLELDGPVAVRVPLKVSVVPVLLVTWQLVSTTV